METNMIRNPFAITALLLLAGALIACEPSEGTEEVVIRNASYSKSGYDVTPLPRERVAELAKKLTPEQYRITQAAGTERPFCGGLLDNKKTGTYVCVVCGLPLFRSKTKFDSGTGWPSFFEPFDPLHVAQIADESHGMTRVETRCVRCSAHLGHVFDDGPAPTGLRFCINGESLAFHEDGAELPKESRPISTATAYFAAGCFWGVEDVFQQIEGVIDAESGYMGGKIENPTYEQVCRTRTGHAETVKVVYDEARVSYETLLDVFFKNHDPTTIDRQGPDVGEQYRSAIFASTEGQKAAAETFVAKLATDAKYSKRRIVTQIVPPGPKFWPAEEYHQDYHAKHGGSCRVVR
jgi:peptide methionine sulfoxide reductase msrA/msrB